MVDGAVSNQIDFSRTLNLATDIAGVERVIFRVALDPKPAT
jgi:hypothetical protein